MSYRKARTQHNEISLWLTCSTYRNPTEKEKTVSINHSNHNHQLYNKGSSVSWSLHSWKRWWRWDKGWNHNSWCTGTLWGLLEHVPAICLFHWWHFFSGKSKISGVVTTLLKCQNIRISELSVGLKEICCIIRTGVFCVFVSRSFVWIIIIEVM